MNFSRHVLACAVSAAIVGVAQAGTIDAFNTVNIQPDPGTGLAEIYQDPPANTDTNGYIDYSSGSYPGIEVYQEVFSSGGDTFVGCVMAKLDLVTNPDPTKTPNCQAEQDSSKRIKVNVTEVNAADPADGVDLVFDVTGADPSQLYRWFGKIGNQSAGRVTGFSVELGTGVGTGFVLSADGDGLSVAEVSSPYANFPGGLFGGSPVNPVPFFSPDRAEFEVTAFTQDSLESNVVPTTYSTTFGNWLPLKWVPYAWFFDDDGNPDTDDLIQAWFDGTQWLDGAGNLIAVADLETWETTPVTVTDNGVLYATWNPETELYELAAGGTLTLDEMQAEIQGNPAKVRVPGYSIGEVEDLAKVNINFAIDVHNTAETQFTVRLTPIASTDADVPPAWIDPLTGLRIDPITSADQPGAPPTTVSSSSGGCSVGGDGRPDPTLLALLAAALGLLGWRRYKASH
jgi:hypothetical protein